MIVLLVLTPAAQAQEGSVELGFDIGAFEFDDELGGESEFAAGLRIGYFFTDRFAVEFQTISATSIFDIALDAYLVNAVYYLGNGKPYVSLGAGIAEVEIGSLFGPTFDDSGLALKGALGYRFDLGSSGRSGLRFELLAISEDSFDESSLHVGLTGGYSYRFGG